jgi:hypothetical protein
MRILRTSPPLIALAALAIAGFLAAGPAATRAPKTTHQKFERISSGKMRVGEIITLSDAEVTVFIASGEVELPAGVSGVKVQFRPDLAIIDSIVDLAKSQEAKGKSLNMFMRMLLQGERKLRSTCRYVSADGVGTLNMESFEIDGSKIDGTMLDFLLENLVAPNYPDLKLGEPQDLPESIRQIRLEQGTLVVVGG